MSWSNIAIGVGSAVGGYFGSRGRSGGSQAIDPAQVGSDSLQTQIDLAGPQFGAESIYRPNYAALDLNILRNTLLGAPENPPNVWDMPELQGLEERLREGGDTRTKEQWLSDHMAAFPNDPLVQKVREVQAGGKPMSLIEILQKATPQLQGIDQAATSSQREADIADVEALGPRANEAFRAANPELTGMLDSLRTQADSALTAESPSVTAATQERSALLGGLNTAAERGATGEVNPITAELEKQAYGDLSMGDRLSEAQRRNISEYSRSSWGARGLGRSQGAAIDEALKAFDVGRTLQNERRGFAAGVSQLAEGERGANRAFGLGVEGVNQQLGAFNAQSQNQANMFNVDAGMRQQANNRAFAGSTAQLLSATSQDPFMTILGRPSGSAAQGQALAGGLFGQQSGPSLFNPFSSDIMSIYSGNAANANAASIAAGNNRSALYGAGLGAAGNILASYFGNRG